MRKTLRCLLIAVLLAAGISLPLSALIHTPGEDLYLGSLRVEDQYFGGIPGIDYSWGTYGAVNLAAWTPDRLDLLQWLSSVLSPSTAVDQTANELDANLTKSNCVKLDGIADVCTYTGANATATDFTFSAWALLDDIVSATDDNYLWYQDADNLISLQGTRINLGFNGTFINSAEDWGGSVWNHLCVVRSGTGVTVYMNNVSIRTFDVGSATVDLNGTLGGAVNYFAGQIANFTVSATALTVAEVATLYTTGVIPSPEVQFPMAGGVGAGVTEYDISGNGNDGTWTTGAGGEETLRSGTQDVYHPNLINGCSKLIGLDGTAYATISEIDLGNTFTVGAKYYFPNVGGYHQLCGAADNNNYIRVESNIKVAFKLGSTYRSLSGISPAFSKTEANTIILRKTGTVLSVFANGVKQTDTTVGAGDVLDNLVALFAQDTAATPEYANGESVSTFMAASALDDATCLDYDSATEAASNLWSAKDAYGTTLPDSTGTNDATLVNTSFNYLPALADGTDDVAGLGLTNPSGSVHNNFEGFIQQKAANTEFLDNAFWSANGSTFDEKSFEDLITHIDLDNLVIVAADSPLVSDVITLTSGAMFTPVEYNGTISWLELQGDTGEHLIPYIVLEGGLGPSNTYYTADGIHVYLVEE